MSARRGFTFIELLVVIAIIAALAGMSLAALSLLRKQQKTASTWDLMTNITAAVDQYMRDHARLGAEEDSSDFLGDPWRFLHKNYRRQKQQPLIDIKLERLVERKGPDSCVRATELRSATHIADHFGTNAVNVLSFAINNANRKPGNDATRYVQCIILRSSAGTYGDPKDDLIMAFSSDKASWRKLRYEDVDAFTAELDPPWTYDKSKWIDPLKHDPPRD